MKLLWVVLFLMLWSAGVQSEPNAPEEPSSAEEEAYDAVQRGKLFPADQATEAAGYDSVCPYCTDPEGSSAHTVNVTLNEETQSTADLIKFPPPRKEKKESKKGLR